METHVSPLESFIFGSSFQSRSWSLGPSLLGRGEGGGGVGLLNKVKYGEAPPQGVTPYPFIYHFGRKSTPLIYL